MRTTVTLDPDTEALLKAETEKTGLPFKVVLNQAVRRSLMRRSVDKVALLPLFTAPFPQDLQQMSMNHLADSLDDDRTLSELQS